MKPPELPPFLAYTWVLWLDLHAQRRRGFAADPITYADLDARARVTGQRLSSWEATAVRKIDDAYLLTMAEASKEETSPPQRPVPLP